MTVRLAVAALACLLLGACSSSPRRGSDPGEPSPDGGGAAPVNPGVDAAPGAPIVDPPPGTPTARLMGFPLDIDFGNVNTGSAARTNAVVITNIGDAPTKPLEAALTSSPDLKLTTNCTRRVLRPEETCVVTAEFAPRQVGPHTASGAVDDGPGGLAPINFMAKGTGRLGPDAGPDTARPLLDGGADLAMPRDVAASPDLARDLAPDVTLPRDTAPDLAAAADTRD